VGIKGAKGAGNGGIGEVARIGQTGRATVRWRERAGSGLKGKKEKGEESGSETEGKQLFRGGMSLGGGVMMIDSVLIPYEPSWFSR
jgi:solute carrier family 25 carnitine/acylcarnitine transporter 20/29